MIRLEARTFFPMSYRNNKHVVRQARSKPHIQILALSRIFSHNQTLGESLTGLFSVSRGSGRLGITMVYG